MAITLTVKHCARCERDLPATTDYFYVARARGGRKRDTLQSYCKDCWKEINKEGRERRSHKIEILYLDCCILHKDGE